MKKFLSLLCMITCVFGLTACGSSEAYTEYELSKMEAAKNYAIQYVIPSMENFKDAESVAVLKEYTAEEVEYLVAQNMGFGVDGYAFMTAIESFNSAYETVGNLKNIGEATAEIDGKQIIVRVVVECEQETAEAELVFTNDMFMNLESAALNPKATMADLMAKAGMNTLIGMGTVFAVLLLISFIISCFNIISKIQAKSSQKEKKEEVKETAIENVVAQIATQEESVELVDDYELVAVIAAAIAASQGATSTDGFVVRSIRRKR